MKPRLSSGRIHLGSTKRTQQEIGVSVIDPLVKDSPRKHSRCRGPFPSVLEPFFLVPVFLDHHVLMVMIPCPLG
jgi:hypothetical protein